MGDQLTPFRTFQGADKQGAEVRGSTVPHHHSSPVGGVVGAEVRTLSCGVGQGAEDLAHVGQGCRMNGFTLAIDIGRNGALALFDAAGRLVDVEDLPTLEDGPALRRTISGPLLAAIVRRWQPASAVVEHVAARPGEAAPGAFAFGRSRGVIEGVLAAHGVPVTFRTPAWWKRRVGIPAGRDMKDLARSQAIARWPDRAELFARKRDHDRAEACLIGMAHIAEESRP